MKDNKTEQIRKFIINNWFCQKAYSAKFYLNLGIAQISWFTGKLPEIMAFVYLSKWVGYDLSRNGLFVFGIGVTFGLTLFGYVWKKTGLYDTEVIVNAYKNPIQMEVLNAARKINKNEVMITKCNENYMKN